MSSKKFNLIMIGLTVLLGVAIIAALFGANALLKQQSKKLYDLKKQSLILNQQQLNLVQAKKDITKYSELEREAKLIVPQDKDQAEAVREIVNIAKASNVSISSIIFPTSTLGTGPASSSTTGTPPAATTQSSTSTKSPVTQTQQVTGLKGVYVMPITVQSTNNPVPYSNFVNFLSKLEQNRRTSQVSTISIQPLGTDPSQVNFTLIINAYIKP